jgi:hypothetical protein
MGLKLNLGAGDRRIHGFLSVDVCPPADIVADLSKPWPWENSSVTEVKAFDIFEHLPNKIHSMNELWRVLTPCGMAEIEVPTVPGVGSVCDPTHCSYWSAGDFEYYEKGNPARERFQNSYGIKADFIIKNDPIFRHYQNRFGEEVRKVRIMLEAVK